MRSLTPLQLQIVRAIHYCPGIRIDPLVAAIQIQTPGAAKSAIYIHIDRLYSAGYVKPEVVVPAMKRKKTSAIREYWVTQLGARHAQALPQPS